MNENYSYPLLDGLNDNEVIKLVTFFQQVEAAYERPNGVNRQAFINAYRTFTTMIPSKMEQKQLAAQFEERSGYSVYRVIKQSKQPGKNLKVNEA